MAAYARGEYDVVQRSFGRLADLSKVIKDFDFNAGVNPWPAAPK
jgi:hypothetical protein